MKSYQILKRNGPGEKWEFVAHGAVYQGDEGRDIERLLAENGRQSKRIAL